MSSKHKHPRPNQPQNTNQRSVAPPPAPQRSREGWEDELAAKAKGLDDRIASVTQKQKELESAIAEAAAAKQLAEDVRKGHERASAEAAQAKVELDKQKATVAALETELATSWTEAEALQKAASEHEAHIRLKREEADCTAAALTAEKARYEQLTQALAEKSRAAEQEASSYRIKQAQADAAQAELAREKAAFEVAATAREEEARARERAAQAAVVEEIRRALQVEEESSRTAREAADEAAREQRDKLLASTNKAAVQLREEILKNARAEAHRITEEAARSKQRLDEENERREKNEADRQEHAERRRKEHEEKLAAIKKRAAELDEEKEALQQRSARLDRRQDRIEHLVEERAAEQLAGLQGEKATLEKRLTWTEGRLEQLLVERNALHDQVHAAGGDSAPALKRRNEQLLELVAELRSKEGNAPSPDQLEALRARAAIVDEIDKANARLKQRVVDLESRLAERDAEAVHEQGERVRVEALQAVNAGLRSELQHLTKGLLHEASSPLQNFMDVDDEQARVDLRAPRAIDSLRTMTIQLRNEMARGGDPRFYSERVVTTFVAGLAAAKSAKSRLLILQGLCGTGKTSLPLAVARVLGAGCDVIEVQSQWRDRGDLLGSYNPFHRRFYAQRFALALYRAATAEYRNRPYFIVLDEMNLSHVEHYFADILSKMERAAAERPLHLIEDAEELKRANRPTALLSDGRLAIPENVWFVGTANRDESTRPISDKVYDRAVIIELNEDAEGHRFTPAANVARPEPVALDSLLEHFERAPRVDADSEGRASRFLKSVESTLKRRFRITRTNRFREQWQTFLPVYLASHPRATTVDEREKCLGEAADHFLATKLLRALRERFDPHLEERIKELHEVLEANWDKRWGKLDGTESVRLLADEKARVAQTGEAE